MSLSLKVGGAALLVVLAAVATGCAASEEVKEKEKTGTVSDKLAGVTCQFLGENAYCDGTTSVHNYDYWCTNSDGVGYARTEMSLMPDTEWCMGIVR